MSAWSSLLSTTIKQHFGLSVLRDKYIRRKEALWQPLVALLLVITAVLPMVWLYIKILNTTYDVSLQLNQPGLVLLMGFLFAQSIVLFFGIFYLMSVFYFSHDLETLVPLPLKPETIMGAKLSVILISEYITTLPLVAPPIIIYGLRQGVAFGYWISAFFISLLLPMLPLALAGILVVLLMRFTRLARRPDTVRVISMLLLFVGIIVAQLKITSWTSGTSDPAEFARMLASGPNSLLSLVGQKFPPSLWGALSLTNLGAAGAGAAALRYLSLFLAATAASVALLWLLARHSFYQGLLATVSPVAKSRRRNTRATLRGRPQWLALTTREWKIVMRHPIWALTAAQTILVPPLLLGVAVFSGNSLSSLRQLAENPQVQSWIPLALAGMIAINPLISSISATSVSREGNLFWISRVIPVSATVQLASKLLFSIFTGVIAGIFIVAILLWIGVPFTVTLLGFALGLLYSVPINALGLAVDVLAPRLDWSNPQQAMKGNFNNIIALAPAAGITYLFARVLIAAFKAGWSPAAIYWLGMVVAAGLGLVMLQILFRLGPTLYAPAAGEHAVNFSTIMQKWVRPALVFIAVTVGAFFIGREFLGGVLLKYEFAPDAISFAGNTISYDEITEVRYLERIPPLSNRFGTQVGNYASGTFTVAGIGRGRVVAKDLSQPGLLIFTKETFYVITPPDAAMRYEEVAARINEDEPADQP